MKWSLGLFLLLLALYGQLSWAWMLQVFPNALHRAWHREHCENFIVCDIHGKRRMKNLKYLHDASCFLSWPRQCTIAMVKRRKEKDYLIELNTWKKRLSRTLNKSMVNLSVERWSDEADEIGRMECDERTEHRTRRNDSHGSGEA